MFDPVTQLFAGVGLEPAAVVDQAATQPARQQRAQLRAGAGRLFAQRGLEHPPLVVGHGLEAQGQQCLEGVGVGHVDVRAHVQRGRDAQHLRQPQRLQALDRGPADVELPAAQRELRRAREGVVVVVQLLAADPHAPGAEVGGGVGGLEVAVAPPVAQAVDHACGPERDPQHLDRPDRDAGRAEQGGVDRQHQHRAEVGVRCVQLALDPVVGAAAAVLLDIAAQRARLAVQLHAAPEHRADALVHRAVRILLGLALGVVLAMDRHPLLHDHRRGKPAPEAEEVRQHRVEVDAAVRLAAVQVQRHGEDGELRDHQQVGQQAPDAGLDEAAGDEVEQGSGHGVDSCAGIRPP